MTIGFAIWTGLLALLVYGGFTAFEYVNFGDLVFLERHAMWIGGGWLALVVVHAVLRPFIAGGRAVSQQETPRDVQRAMDQSDGSAR